MQLLLREALEQVTRKCRNVGAPLTQRRKVHDRDADPLAEHLVEALRKRGARRGDQADVDRRAAVAADRADFAGSEHAVERLLRELRKRGDFVEDERAHVGFEHSAVLLGEGARKGTFDMAEQFAVDDICGDGLAIDDDHRPASTEAGSVDCAGDGFLAGPRLADDENRQAVARGLGRDGERGSIFGRRADELLER